MRTHSVQLLSCVWLFATPWIVAHQASLSITSSWTDWCPSCPSSLDSCPSSWWCHPIISSSVVPFSCLQSFLASEWVGSSRQVAKVLEFQLQHLSFQWIFRIDFLWYWPVWSPYSPRDSQESSPTPQFKSINSSVINFFYNPTLSSLYDWWKNYSFD